MEEFVLLENLSLSVLGFALVGGVAFKASRREDGAGE
jgi:hypothetical protein